MAAVKLAKKKATGGSAPWPKITLRVSYRAVDALREGKATPPPCAVRVQGMEILLSNIECVSFRKMCFYPEAAEVYHRGSRAVKGLMLF